MTNNQIQYWNLQEAKRHNFAGEEETSRHNKVTESVDIGQLAETSRHNRVTENETSRHNQATEGIDVAKLHETSRHNMEAEAQGRVDLNISRGNLNALIAHNALVDPATVTKLTSDAQLSDVKTKYQEILNESAGLQQLANINLTQAQKEQVEAAISKMNAEIERLSQQIDWNNYDKALQGLDTMAGMIRSTGQFLQNVLPKYGGGTSYE